MPFTLAHPAIILPLAESNWRFSFTGLIIGSMVPDFEFYFRMKVVENIGHHWAGIFIFDLPLAVALCFIYHNIIRNNFIIHLPSILSERLSSFTSFNWNKYAIENKLVIIASLFTGILSHLLWDSFTHHDGVFVVLIPLLRESIAFPEFEIQLFNVLQVAGSVWGLWAVYRYVLKLPVNKKSIPVSLKTTMYWSALVIASISILYVRVKLLTDYNSPVHLLFAGIGSIIYSWMIISIIFKVFKRINWQE